MFLQALVAEGMKAGYGLGFGVIVQTDRTSYILFEVFQKRLHLVKLHYCAAECKMV